MDRFSNLIDEYIIDGKIGSALSKIMVSVKLFMAKSSTLGRAYQEVFDTAIILNSQFKLLEKRMLLNLFPYDEYRIELSKITTSVLELKNDLNARRDFLHFFSDKIELISSINDLSEVGVSISQSSNIKSRKVGVINNLPMKSSVEGLGRLFITPTFLDLILEDCEIDTPTSL
ncbi:MAG: hypothetical protein AAFY76_17085, partial [Cyanobacteria bacterium J06649_11]